MNQKCANNTKKFEDTGVGWCKHASKDCFAVVQRERERRSSSSNKDFSLEQIPKNGQKMFLFVVLGGSAHHCSVCNEPPSRLNKLCQVIRASKKEKWANPRRAFLKGEREWDTFQSYPSKRRRIGILSFKFVFSKRSYFVQEKVNKFGHEKNFFLKTIMPCTQSYIGSR